MKRERGNVTFPFVLHDRFSMSRQIERMYADFDATRMAGEDSTLELVISKKTNFWKESLRREGEWKTALEEEPGNRTLRHLLNIAKRRAKTRERTVEWWSTAKEKEKRVDKLLQHLAGQELLNFKSTVFKSSRRQSLSRWWSRGH